MLLLLLLAGLHQFRVTLNAPAVRLVVGSAPAIELEAEKGIVRLRPSHSEAAHKLAPRGAERGGLEAIISGPQVQDLLQTLMVISGQQQRKPIFALEKDSERIGWYRLAFCREAPGRHIPQLRLWLATDVVREPQRVLEEPDWAAEVRRAFAVVAAYEEGGRIGRPSKEVAAAQETVAVFTQLARELLPPSVSRAAVEEVRAAFDRALGSPT